MSTGSEMRPEAAEESTSGYQPAMTAVENEIRQASDRFYDALRRGANGEAGPMSEVWVHGPEASALHPTGSIELGWDQVWPVFQQLAGGFSGGKIAVSDLKVIALTNDCGYTVGREIAEGTMAGQAIRFETRATNIYRREGKSWKIVHHHADVVPEMQEILARVTAQ